MVMIKMLENLIKKLPSRRHFEIICYGAISGMPFAILYTALVVWLKEGGYILSTVTTIAASRLPYSFKYIWAPLVDSIKIPFLHKFGRRRSWMIMSLVVICAVMVAFSFVDTKDNFNLIYVLALTLGFASATYDIAFDAFRIDSFEAHEQGLAVANTILGYRIGMALVSSVGLYISTLVEWNGVFFITSIFFFSAILYIPFLREPKYQGAEAKNFVERIKISVIEPFADFLMRKNALFNCICPSIFT